MSAIGGRPTGLARILRLLSVGWVMHMKMLTRSSFNFLLGIVYPLFFATVSFFMFRAGNARSRCLCVARRCRDGDLGATSTSAGSALRESAGTARSSCSSPRPPTLRRSCCRSRSRWRRSGLRMVATLAWGGSCSGSSCEIAHRSPSRRRARRGHLDRRCSASCSPSRSSASAAWALGNLLEFPVWLICGFLVPLVLFPAWVRRSWALAPTWGMSAIRGARTRRLALRRHRGCAAPGGRPRRPASCCSNGPAAAAPEGVAVPLVTGASIFAIGGLISYRALFGWLSPWVFIPSLLVAPVFQILLFVYIGRSAALESDELLCDRQRAPVLPRSRASSR